MAMKKNPEKILRDLDLKSTTCRIGILSVLLKTKRPLSEDQIADKIKNRKVNKTTVYRNLSRFVQEGIVHKAYLNDRKWHYELSHNCTDSQCHPHFTCVNCGQTHCLVGVNIPLVTNKNGFSIHRQKVHLDGLCPKCSSC